jgi:hypothetical protein
VESLTPRVRSRRWCRAAADETVVEEDRVLERSVVRLAEHGVRSEFATPTIDPEDG